MSLVREKGRLVRKMSAPTRVRNYDFSIKIGQGAFGVVYCAKSGGSAARYAIKVINLRRCTEREVNNCRMEAELMRTIQHKHLVGFVDAFEEVGKTATHLYIVMEFCEGGSLRDKIVGGMSFPMQTCLKIFSQVCEALEYLHCRSEPIIHRDVKTSNIFFGFEYQAKLGDLGVARLLEKGNFASTMNVGTPYYMSPEVISNKPYDTQTDIWSLGLCLYEMAHGKRPFDSVSDAGALKTGILSGEVTNCELPYDNKDMTRLFQVMVQYESERRPNICEVLKTIQCIKDKKSLDMLSERPSKYGSSRNQNSAHHRSISEPCHPADKARNSPRKGDKSRKHSKPHNSEEANGKDAAMVSQGASARHTKEVSIPRTINTSNTPLQDDGYDMPNCGIEHAFNKMGIDPLGQESESTDSGQNAQLKRRKKKRQVLSKSYPLAREAGYRDVQGSSGYISTQLEEATVEQNQKIKLVEVELSEDQLEFYEQGKEMERQVKACVECCPKVFDKIKAALYATRQMESSQQFEVQAKHIFNENGVGSIFYKCKPFLVALWEFKTQLLTKPPKIIWI